MAKTKCIARFWEDDEFSEPEDIEIEVAFEDQDFFIDGLKEGRYLSIPLHVFAQAMADSTRLRDGQIAS